jgi:hypothetical protein
MRVALVEPAQIIGEPSLPAGVRFALQAIDEIDDLKDSPVPVISHVALKGVHCHTWRAILSSSTNRDTSAPTNG